VIVRDNTHFNDIGCVKVNVKYDRCLYELEEYILTEFVFEGGYQYQVEKRFEERIFADK
jgi:hypothetical protein